MCFNGSVVAFCVLYGFAVGFAVGFVIFLSRWCCALVIVCFLWLVWICFAACAFSVCVCVVDFGGPVWADLWCVYYMWFWLRFWLVGRVWPFVCL